MDFNVNFLLLNDARYVGGKAGRDGANSVVSQRDSTSIQSRSGRSATENGSGGGTNSSNSSSNQNNKIPLSAMVTSSNSNNAGSSSNRSFNLFNALKPNLVF